MEKRIPLGRTMITRGANEVLTESDVRGALQRHAKSDWGDVCREDWEANDRALNDGARLLSSFQDEQGTKFWIITEADRSVTTVLLPEEY